MQDSIYVYIPQQPWLSVCLINLTVNVNIFHCVSSIILKILISKPVLIHTWFCLCAFASMLRCLEFLPVCPLWNFSIFSNISSKFLWNCGSKDTPVILVNSADICKEMELYNLQIQQRWTWIYKLKLDTRI